MSNRNKAKIFKSPCFTQKRLTNLVTDPKKLNLFLVQFGSANTKLRQSVIQGLDEVSGTPQQWEKLGNATKNNFLKDYANQRISNPEALATDEGISEFDLDLTAAEYLFPKKVTKPLFQKVEAGKQKVLETVPGKVFDWFMKFFRPRTSS